MYNNTIFFFSSTGYNNGFHKWTIECESVNSCQTIGIVSKPNPKYRHGYNIFDDLDYINTQVGDRYLYCGDSNNSWRSHMHTKKYVKFLMLQKICCELCKCNMSIKIIILVFLRVMRNIYNNHQYVS